MGCVNSKKELPDTNPHYYRVMNIDENGADLSAGQIEITETDIILFRERRETTLWPLHSLRRYGFEGEIFSFESGRRCETGEGIYAFRCRRASLLFHTLQQKIQLRNVIHDSVSYPVSRLTPSPQGRQTLQASVVHRSSVDNGQPDSRAAVNNLSNNAISVQRPVSQVSRSPSTADILEVMPLYPRPQSTQGQVTNVYQVRDFKKEHNNNQADSHSSTSNSRHLYCNDINRDLAILRNTLRQEAAINTVRDIEDENQFLEGRYINDQICIKKVDNPLSPAISNSSEHYAQLSVEQQEAARLYVNVSPNENNTTDKNELSDESRMETSLMPLTPKQAEYCNVPITLNTYANISLGEIADNIKLNVKQFNFNSTLEHYQKFSESDTFTSLSPVEEIEVNYAILDIDCSKDTKRKSISDDSTSSGTLTRVRFGKSGDKQGMAGPSNALATIGYTTIDFDKTVALTSVAASNEAEIESGRKSRLNSCNSSIPSIFEKSKLSHH